MPLLYLILLSGNVSKTGDGRRRGVCSRLEKWNCLLVGLAFFGFPQVIHGQSEVSVETVGIYNVDDRNPYGIDNEYRIYKENGEEICFLQRNTFAEIPVPFDGLKIRIKTSSVSGTKAYERGLLGARLSSPEISLTKADLGKRFVIQRDYFPSFSPLSLQELSKEPEQVVEVHLPTDRTREEEYSPRSVQKVSALIGQGLDRNYDKILPLSKQLSESDREVLYSDFQLNPSPSILNIVPGWGMGSMVENDPMAGLFTLGALATTSVCFVSGIVVFGDFVSGYQNPSVYASNGYNQAKKVFVVSFFCDAAISLIGFVRGISYPYEYNARLQKALEM